MSTNQEQELTSIEATQTQIEDNGSLHKPKRPRTEFTAIAGDAAIQDSLASSRSSTAIPLFSVPSVSTIQDHPPPYRATSSSFGQSEPHSTLPSSYWEIPVSSTSQSTQGEGITSPYQQPNFVPPPTQIPFHDPSAQLKPMSPDPPTTGSTLTRHTARPFPTPTMSTSRPPTPSPITPHLSTTPYHFPPQAHYIHQPLPTNFRPMYSIRPDPERSDDSLAAQSSSFVPSPTPHTYRSSNSTANSPSPPIRESSITPHPPATPIITESSAEKTKTKGKGKHKGIPGPKARIPSEAKVTIAEHIIAKGVTMANLDELAQITGLTKQQIKSQLVDNRQNVRKQLNEFARGLQ
ncbi:uncharacterized protein I206_101639 [Kwoniella pini CBS 10737]|uniref:Uncharacterized protein n=1 Tax=Kwoniella pini CBS 10737 TaxID=1296096 RepID=A0A1B9HW45_9TREE|nr:uncharacterized protein I206_06391 [Kwoniella pini CBS 10737]OCF47490.1 hypothetical protein I206_06391 [Kwoniella pini CBS 10737]